MNDELSDFIGTINARTVTVRAADGRTMVQTKALHVAAVPAGAIRIERVRTSFQEHRYRTPYKFGGVPVDFVEVMVYGVR